MKPYLSLFSFLLFLSSNYAVRAQPKAIFVGLSRSTEWVVSDICIQDEFNLPTMRYDIDGRNRGAGFSVQADWSRTRLEVGYFSTRYRMEEESWGTNTLNISGSYSTVLLRLGFRARESSKVWGNIGVGLNKLSPDAIWDYKYIDNWGNYIYRNAYDPEIMIKRYTSLQLGITVDVIRTRFFRGQIDGYIRLFEKSDQVPGIFNQAGGGLSFTLAFGKGPDRKSLANSATQDSGSPESIYRFYNFGPYNTYTPKKNEFGQNLTY